jgi:hypothetical protein
MEVSGPPEAVQTANSLDSFVDGGRTARCRSLTAELGAALFRTSFEALRVVVGVGRRYGSRFAAPTSAWTLSVEAAW